MIIAKLGTVKIELAHIGGTELRLCVGTNAGFDYSNNESNQGNHWRRPVFVSYIKRNGIEIGFWELDGNTKRKWSRAFLAAKQYFVARKIVKSNLIVSAF